MSSSSAISGATLNSGMLLLGVLEYWSCRAGAREGEQGQGPSAGGAGNVARWWCGSEAKRLEGAMHRGQAQGLQTGPMRAGHRRGLIKLLAGQTRSRRQVGGRADAWAGEELGPSEGVDASCLACWAGTTTCWQLHTVQEHAAEVCAREQMAR